MRRLLSFFMVLSATLAVVAGPAPWSEADTFTTHDRVVSDFPRPGTPQVRDGTVLAVAKVGDMIVVGGNFTTVRDPSGTDLVRNYLFAFNVVTNQVSTTFVPVLNAVVETLAPAPGGQSVFVGGRFTDVSGTRIRGVAKLDIASGQPMAGFTGNVANRSVYDMVVVANRLFIACNFNKARGQDRSILAALDATTGAVDPNVNFVFSEPLSTSQTMGVLSMDKIDVTPDGSRLVVVGNFSKVDGQQRYRVAMLDTGSAPARLADWSTTRYQAQCRALKWPQYLRDMEVSPDGSYFVIGTTGAYFAPGGNNPLCDTAARWETFATGSNLQPTWVDYTGGDTLYGVAITGHAVYVGGHPRWLNNPFAADRAGPGAVPRMGIAALDPLNGLPLTWDPGRNPRGRGTYELLPTNDGLWVGQDTSYIGGVYRGRLALMPLAGGTAIPPSVVGRLPNHLYAAGTLRPGSPSSGTDLVRRWFDGKTTGEPTALGSTGEDWSTARGTFMVSGKLYSGSSDGKFYVRTFDGATVGPRTEVNLYGLTSSHFPLANVTGMFFDAQRHRIYYTVAGNARLLYRYFTPESQIVGAETYVASGSGWLLVAGMTLASDNLYVATTDGSLRKISFAGGTPATSPGNVAPFSGPTIDGIDWAARGLFVPSFQADR